MDKIILFDIDYTLFDTTKYRSLVFIKLQELLPDVAHVPQLAEESYEEIRKTSWFAIEKFKRAFLQHVPGANPKIIERVWQDTTLLKESLYPEVTDVLEKLAQKHITFGIFSAGAASFQRSKLTELQHFFQDEHIHIHTIKENNLATVLEKYKDKQVFLVDDYLPIIEKAKKINAGVVTIWVKRGRFAAHFTPSADNPPDYTITDLSSLPDLI